MEPIRKFIQRHPVAGILVAALVGLIVAGGIGAALALSKSNQVSDREAEVENLSADLAEVEKERDEAQATADRITGRRDSIISKAQNRAESITSDAQTKLGRVEVQLERAEGKLSNTQATLTQVETSLEDARREKQLSSFGDGTWQADVDYLPGTYRTDGGSGCYWAKLNSTDTFDIADNNNGVGPQVVTIDSPYFQTEACGTWKRTGG